MEGCTHRYALVYVWLVTCLSQRCWNQQTHRCRPWPHSATCGRGRGMPSQPQRLSKGPELPTLAALPEHLMGRPALWCSLSLSHLGHLPRGDPAPGLQHDGVRAHRNQPGARPGLCAGEAPRVQTGPLPCILPACAAAGRSICRSVELHCCQACKLSFVQLSSSFSHPVLHGTSLCLPMCAWEAC
jgi:hypothetical protein